MDNKGAIEWLRAISATQTQSSHTGSLEFRKEALYIAIKAIEELEQYKIAEEQGLLLRLPCKVGDTAWVIDVDNEYPGKKKIYEAKWTRVTFVQVSANHTFELRGEVSYRVYDYFSNDGRTMPCGMYVGQTHTKVGEVVFLTKEEAEQALKQMGE